MALNFGLLNQGGPSGFYEGFTQAGEKMQANAMAQQKADQAQQEFGMRQQEFAAGQADKQRVANTAMVTQRTLAARDALLRAPNPEAARAIVRAQHADPYLGRIRQQFGTLEQDLAEVPDEPTAFQQYKEREAMGADEFLKRQASTREFATAMGGTQAMPQAAPTNAMAPAGAAAPAPMANAMAAPAMSGELQTKLAQLQRLSTLANQTPQVKSAIDQLNKDVARLSPAAPTTPASVSEYNFAVQQGYKGSLFDFKRDLAKAGQAAGTTVVMPPQERAEKGARGTMLVDEFKGISATARNAAKNLPTLETQERILEGGFKTGFGTDAQKAGASILSALGVPEATTYAAKAETFNAAANSAVLQKQLEQKGTQSQSDADRMEKTVAQLGNTVEGNKFIISVAKAQLKRDIEQRNFYSGWWNKNKTYDGAEEAWFSGEGDKSLFDRPELKKYAAPQSAPTPGKPAAAGGHPADIQAIINAQKRR